MRTLQPDENTRLVHARPLQFRRRALHLQNPAKGNIRRSHGGTVSQGFKRGSLVKHPKHGLTTVGGTKDGRVSLHNLNGKRLCQNAKAQDITLLRRSSIAFRQIPKNGIPLSAKADSLLPENVMKTYNWIGPKSGKKMSENTDEFWSEVGPYLQ